MAEIHFENELKKTTKTGRELHPQYLSYGTQVAQGAPWGQGGRIRYGPRRPRWLHGARGARWVPGFLEAPGGRGSHGGLTIVGHDPYCRP